LAERSEYGFILPAPSHGVAVEPRDAGAGEMLVQRLFHSLRAAAEKIDVLAAALGAHRRHRLGVIAIMAKQALVAAVVSERHRAIPAHHPLAAATAGCEPRKAAALEHDHALLARLEPRLYRLQQPPREEILLACLEELEAQVDQFHARERPSFDALPELEQRVFPARG